jgi:hypothetical protein
MPARRTCVAEKLKRENMQTARDLLERYKNSVL